MNAPGRAPGPKSVRKHLLTGVLLCGKPACGARLSGNWVKAGPVKGPRGYSITCACKSCRGVSVRAEHVEPMLLGLLVERLARPDAETLLRTKVHDLAEAEKLRTEEAVLRARLAQLGMDFATAPPEFTQAALSDIQGKLDAIAKRQQDQELLRGFEGLPLGTDKVGENVEKLSPDRLRAVIDVLMTVTVAPVGKGYRVFNPDRVDVVWKEDL
jgi:hypothetical protein